MSEKNSKQPLATAFRQQNLKAWQPILTPMPVIVTFLIVGIVFLPIGIALLSASNDVKEYTRRYDDICTGGEAVNFDSNASASCTVTIEIEEKMSKPVYFYYELTNYYQNHRRYVSSRDDVQLRGETGSSSVECDPRESYTNPDTGEKFNFLPCGLIAWSMFNDTYVMSYPNSNNTVPMKKSGIAWESDLNDKFRNPSAETAQNNIRVISDFKDEEFVVWMRTAALPTFRKLHRIIETDLEPGTYSIALENNYPVHQFDGEKRVVISTTSWMGGKNPFLGWAYIIVGVLCLVLGIGFFIKHKVHPRKLGDTRYLDWTK